MRHQCAIINSVDLRPYISHGVQLCLVRKVDIYDGGFDGDKKFDGHISTLRVSCTFPDVSTPAASVWDAIRACPGTSFESDGETTSRNTCTNSRALGVVYGDIKEFE